MRARLAILPIALLSGAGLCAQTPSARGATSPASTISPPAASTAAPLQKNAATGNAAAEVALGQRLMKSKDPADKAAAAKWFREAAMQGNADGEWELGSAYFGGAGVTRDTATGLTWMRKSLSDGSADHMAFYGYVSDMMGFLSGNNQESQEGAKWIRRAAEAGSTKGMEMLGFLSLSGKMGMTKNTASAEHWLLKAARLGDVNAQEALGTLYLSDKTFGPPNPKASVHWLAEAAQQGNVEAEGTLGYLLVSGDKHVPKNPSEGVQWGEKAVAKRGAAGYYTLGYAYQHGAGEPVDPAKAWYNFAAAERLDTKHQFSHVGDQMSAVATRLSSAQLEKLQSEVAKIPVPDKTHNDLTANRN